MEDNKKIYSVLELNTFIKRLINSEYLLSNVYIKGEASNVRSITMLQGIFILQLRAGTTAVKIPQSQLLCLKVTHPSLISALKKVWEL